MGKLITMIVFLTYGKLTLAYQTGTYANFGVTMIRENTHKPLIILMVGFAVGRSNPTNCAYTV